MINSLLFSTILLPLICFGFIHFYSLGGPIFVFLVGIVDSGHVYTTFLRTSARDWCNYHRSRGLQYKILALAFGSSLALIFLFPRFFWSYLFYFTVFHHIRQNFGIYKFILNSEENKEQINKITFYLATSLPFISLHFKSQFNFEYYISAPLFSYPNDLFFSTCISINVLLIIFLFLFFVRKPERLKKSSLFVLSLSIVYFLSLTFSKTSMEVISIMVLVHGLPYLIIMGLTLTNIPGNFRHSFKKAIYVICCVVIVFGGIEFFLEEEVLYSYFDLNKNNFVTNLFLALFFTPLIFHYIADGIIWRRRDRNFNLVLEKFRR